MAVMKNQSALLKKLKQRIKILQKKEEGYKRQLRAALTQTRSLSKSYKIKLAGKIRDMQGRLAEMQATTYGKIAATIERQLLKTMQIRSKALMTAAARIEKKYSAKLKENIKKQKSNPTRKKSKKKH